MRESDRLCGENYYFNTGEVMSISAQQVKELRERTGLGMMECKTALRETQGDMEAAADLLRKKAGAKVERRAGRIAADGAIGLHLSGDRKLAAMVEVNSKPISSPKAKILSPLPVPAPRVSQRRTQRTSMR